MSQEWYSRNESTSDEWYTPKEIVDALGVFDLDPCAPKNRLWDTAKNHFTKDDDGLSKEWNGRVWLNPPYGNATKEWMKRLAVHGNGIALIPARVDTQWFFESVWNGAADAILFYKGRVRFYDGTKAGERTSPNFACVFVAYGEANAEALRCSTLEGRFIQLKPNEVAA